MSSKPISPDVSETPALPASNLLRLAVTRFKRLLRWLVPGLVLGVLALIEIRTSLLQAWLFTRTNERVFYKIEEGKSPAIAFPRHAPYDDRRGYSKLAAFQARLENHGFEVIRQARQSETMVDLIHRGISPPFIEPAATGIQIRGSDDLPLFQYAQSDFLFDHIEEVPPLLSQTLLFLENRDLGNPDSPWQNPAIEWERLVKAVLLYLGSKLSLPVDLQGGSTLAVQIEKFRHSPRGRTDSPLEKLRQVIGASLKAYREGPNTRAWRDRIIIDYLNSVPLAAAPGYGEIHGLGEGLHAWFGMSLKETADALRLPGTHPDKVKAFKHILALLVSVRAPSTFLMEERVALEDKVNRFTRLMARSGIIDWEMAAALQERPIEFLPSAPLPPVPASAKNKAANAIRTTVMELLGITNLYDLNRLHLQVESTIDVPLQKTVTEFLNSLAEPEVIRRYNLDGERLLEGRDPGKVVYSFLLVESTPGGNLVRVQADNLPGPLDFNNSVKLELGSTAKLRTLTHYLEIMAELYREFSPLDDDALRRRMAAGPDPLTRWAAETLRAHRKIPLEAFLERAMDRRYSASPYEEFFTGGGLHRFENFDTDDDSRVPTLWEAFRSSTNLVFIRLMRDLVSYHRARLPYDAEAVIADARHPERLRLLREIADEESRGVLRRAYQLYRGLAPEQIIERMLGSRRTARHLAIVFFAWKLGGDEAALAAWLDKHRESNTAQVVAELFRAYSSPRLNLADYGYLLSVHPLDLWCAGVLARQPEISWQQLHVMSDEARRISSSWLLEGRNRRAQDLRLRIRAERDSFARMTPYWQRLGFPFRTMVPSYATAIGSSSDRPVALAELIGILTNDGLRRRRTSLGQIHFAPGTPYETTFAAKPESGERVLEPEVARVARRAMAQVVEQGTARRLRGAFTRADGTALAIGGKTGSGDNRFETFNRHGALISSRATNRTAAFVFYIDRRYFGVVTAYVQGQEAGEYRFTSALPVTLLKLLAPTILANITPGQDIDARSLSSP